jgi:hypothetical protein
MNLDVLDEKLREIDANDSLREIPLLVSKRVQIERNITSLRQIKLKEIISQNEILKTSIDLFEQQLCRLDSIDDETFIHLEEMLNILEQNNKMICQLMKNKSIIEELLHTAISMTSECKKLILSVRVVKAIDELNSIINCEQEKINTESEMQSHHEQITIAIIIISSIIIGSATAIFFTIKALLRFSVQVSMTLCAAGFVAMIIALSYLIHQNFHIESLEKHNNANREKINSYTQNLDSLGYDLNLDLEGLRQMSASSNPTLYI